MQKDSSNNPIENALTPEEEAVIDAVLDEEESEISFASNFENPVKRNFIRIIEKLSGQKKMKQLYDHYRENMRGKEPFWNAVIKLLDIDVQFNAARLAEIPATGPLVVVANHPFGVLDGAMICWITSLARERDDFKILTNSVLDSAPESRPYILPVDFSNTKEAMQVNLATRKESLEILANGGCVVIFPAGAVSTSPVFFAKTAIDDEWKPFTAKMISQSGAHVTPIYFEGQNSRLFQMASHISPELRLALIFREVKRRMGSVLPVHIGETLSPEDLQGAGKRAELMNYLRDKTYGMASEAHQAKIRKAAKRMAAREKKPVSLR